MTALLLIAAAYGLLLVTWVMYLAIMNLAARRADLHPVVRVHAYALLLMWRRPLEWTLTYTLKRIQNTEPNDSWRCIAATWFCTYFLNPFDAKGKHC